MRSWPLAMLLAAGCAAGAPDVCAGLGACIAVEVRGGTLAGALDQLRITSSELGLVNVATPTAPRPSPVTPPVYLAIVPPPGFGGDFAVSVRAMRAGVVVATGDAPGRLDAGAHTAVVVTLARLAGEDLAGFDGALAGGELGAPEDMAAPPGSDLAAPPGSDLAVVAAADMALSGPVPRLIAPLSGSTVSTFTPTLRWADPMGTIHIQLCSDRPCATILDEFDTTLTSGASTLTLPARGWVYWRARFPGGPYSSAWQFWVNKLTTARDTSWGAIPDFNGDGRADVALGNAGKVYVFLANPAGGIDATPAVTLTPPDTSSNFGAGGFAVMPAGDVNGDGYVDLIVGAPDIDKAYVFYGGPTGLSQSRFTRLGGMAATSFGAAVSTLGDSDGDGFADVAVGACSVGGGCGNHVRVYRGAAAGVLANTVAVQVDAPAADTANTFGSAIAGADITGDGLGDLVVGSYFYMNGNAYTYHAHAGTGLSKTLVNTLSGDSNLALFGHSIAAAGDVNNDGFEDVIIGGWQHNLATVFIGTTTGLVDTSGKTAPMKRPASMPNDFGFTVAGGADLDDDGKSDVLVGCNGGPTYFYGGDFFGFDPGITWPTVGASSSWGAILLAPGDITGDHIGDVVVSAFDKNKAYVYSGTGGGLAQTLMLQ